MDKLILTALTLALGLTAAPASWSQDSAPDPRAAMLSNTCNSCHGPAGYSPGAIPRIDGLPVEAFVRAMQDFKTDRRPGTIMNRIARGYEDEDFRLMAEFFHRQR